jgi:hypothetical protein
MATTVMTNEPNGLQHISGPYQQWFLLKKKKFSIDFCYRCKFYKGDTMYKLQYGGTLPDVLHKPSLGYYQNAPIQGTAPKHHKHLFSEGNKSKHSLIKK